MTQPNIVLIVTDDQTLESIQRMPLTWASVGLRGINFSNCFTNTAICQSARATLFTGQYSHNNGVVGNNVPYTLLDPTKLLPATLKNAGYATYLVGKYFNTWTTADAVPVGWTDFFGFDPNYYNYNVNHNGVVTSYGSAPSDYSTSVLAARAIADIAVAAEPFFLYVAFNAPHVSTTALSPALPGPDYIGCLPSSKTFPHYADWNPVDVTGKPTYIQNLPLIDGAGSDAINAKYRAVTETLFSVDHAIKAIMDALIAAGKFTNTYVIFVSDNGYFNGEQRLPVGKVAPYENSIRVPLMVAGAPSLVAQSATCNNFVNHSDITATILQLTGVAPAATLDGVSFASYLMAPNATSLRDYVFVEYLGAGDFNGIPIYGNVRSKSWKYTEYNVTGEKELYNMVSDPYELTNVVDVPANAAIVAQYAARVAAGRACSGASCISL